MMQGVQIPNSVDDLTPEWFSQALGVPVSAVDILDAHSGTTGRALVQLTSRADIPSTMFTKLQPFTPEQRAFVRQVGMGIAEARLYAEIGNELPVRAPRVWHANHNAADGSFVMLLEDIRASGCRFPDPDDDDILEVAASTVHEMANLHAKYQGQPLPWLPSPDGTKSKSGNSEKPTGAAKFIQIALDKFGSEMPPAFSRLAQLCIGRGRDIATLFNTGKRTLIHGDAHFGNLFVDGPTTGFFDWAVAGRGTGMRDVAYFLCNSLPPEIRRAEQDGLLDRYLSGLQAQGITLDRRVAEDQYRLFSVYSWIAATSTAAMGSQWQPIEIGYSAMVRTTEAINDLDAVGLLEAQLI